LRRTAFGLTAALSACADGGSAPPTPVPNAAPLVSAGPDFSIDEAGTATLDGTASDPEDALVLAWTQLSGRPVEIATPDVARATFVAPPVAGDEVLRFRLTADDGVNPPVSDDVVVTVRDAGTPVRQLNPPGTSYVDHEIHPTRPEIVFQSFGRVYVGALDPATGGFVSGDGRDIDVDAVASLLQSRNGPEYGLDADGVALFYNKEAGDGSLQFYRAAEDGAGYAIDQLTADGPDRVNQLPSRNAAAPTTWLVYARAAAVPGEPDATGWIAQLDEAAPAVENDVTPVKPGFAGFRWLEGSSAFATTLSTGPDAGQIALVDASTGAVRTVTDDAGVKFDPFPWFAPEYGAVAVLAIVGDGDIAVYRDTGGPVFERVLTLPPPPETSLVYAQSPEPFVSQAGVSYITLTLKNDPGGIFDAVSESEIWIYGLAGGPDRHAFRCDDGAPGRVRSEAEFLSGDGQLLLYYNEVRPSGLVDLYLCETGLSP